MFDVSFSELVLILIVGLVVFGPEKLPEVVRTAGLWLSKLRRSFNHIRSEIEREVGMDEIKRDIHNQGIMDSLKEVHNDLRKTQQDLSQLPRDVRDSINHNTINHNTINHNIDTGHSTVPMEAFPQTAMQPTLTSPSTAAAPHTAHAEATSTSEPESNHRPS